MKRKFYVYILTTKNNKLLYIGVTNNIERRHLEHLTHKGSIFAWNYHVFKLVYIEVYDSPGIAIAREKQLKRWRRSKKDELISRVNSDWREIVIN